MILLGNDVVDLSSPHAAGKGRNHRFIAKVLTGRERDILARSAAPDRTLWRFWAAKEAAYKAVARLYPGVCSSPRRYDVFWQDDPPAGPATGTVLTPAGELNLSCRFVGEAVCCICISPHVPYHTAVQGLATLPAAPLLQDHGTTTPEQSRLVREMAAASIASATGHLADDIRIVNRPVGDGKVRPPEVWINNEKSDITASLSHDGRYLFFAWYSPCIKHEPFALHLYHQPS